MESIFFVGGKIVGYGLKVEIWLSVALLWAGVSIFRSRWAGARRAVMAVAAIWTLFVVLPTGSVLLRALENTYPRIPPAVEADGVIVLGGGVLGPFSGRLDQMQFTDAGERVTEAARIAVLNPTVDIVVTGGASHIGNLSSRAGAEGHIIASYFSQIGISPSRIVIEDRSRTTREHPAALRSAGVDPKARWVIVTSAFHMPRAIRAFERNGWNNLIAYPVDYRVHSVRLIDLSELPERLAHSNLALKELAGRVGYWVFGR